MLYNAIQCYTIVPYCPLLSHDFPHGPMKKSWHPRLLVLALRGPALCQSQPRSSLVSAQTCQQQRSLRKCW